MSYLPCPLTPNVDEPYYSPIYTKQQKKRKKFNYSFFNSIKQMTLCLRESHVERQSLLGCNPAEEVAVVELAENMHIEN